MKAHYNKEILEASHMELVSFSRWMNKNHGNYPIIVGGWAVFSHLSKVSGELGKAKLGSMQLGFTPLGSRDIDVVFGSKYLMDMVLVNYFRANGFIAKKDILEVSYVKEVKTPLGVEQIFIDACTAKDVREIPDLKIKIPWNNAAKFNEKFELDKEAIIYVPIIELLLMQKIGAAIGRVLLRKTQASDYLESKIWKDCYDITNLLARLPVKQARLKKFLEQAKLGKHIGVLFGELKGQREILAEAKTSAEQLQEKIGI
ncbi:MAG: hypothetical protein HY392_00270 [Candidatus Diapherotrites archaeon]|nr:hypothetical protein [Candidatus Diapherotrites archaeon]